MTTFDRRKLLKSGGAALTITLAGCIGPFQDSKGVPGTVERTEDEEVDDNGNGLGEIEDYLDDAPNWDGETVEDLTGEDEVTILNGDADEIGVEGTYVFEPPVKQIDPGTEVTWEWVGTDAHSVTENDGEFDSETFSGDGETFEYTFEEEGVYLYHCIPHEGLGQKGAVIVGDMDEANGNGEEADMEYLDDVPNWDGETVEDMTDEDEVTVLNGDADEIGVEGTYVFEPPVIEVEEGTEVTWEWVGTDAHSVTENDGEFDSETFSGDGETFSHTFEEAGTYLYHCIPHEGLGQKGAVIVE